MRPGLAALLLAVLASGAPNLAACAAAQAAPPFEVVPRRPSDPRSHRAAWIAAFAGVALVATSFPLADEADRRYARYLSEVDVDRIDERYRSTQRMDRLASGSLLAGEALLATAVWLRFVRGDRQERVSRSRVSLDLRTDRCAVALRF